MGLPQACGWLGDFLELRQSRHLFSIGRKVEESFLILRYHRVNDGRSLFTIDAVPTKLFDRQMKYLTSYFNVVSLEEILDCLRSGEKLPKRCLAITFDDGYEDNYLYAFPILKNYSLPATVFLTAGCVDTGEPLWFDQVLYAFDKTSEHTVELPSSGNRLFFRTPDAKLRVAFQTLYHLMTIPDSSRVSDMYVVFSQLGVKPPERIQEHNLLSWSQIQQMVAGGIFFGSHTLTHPILSRMPLEDAKRELAESKRLIESHVQRQVRLFAYPNGRPDDYSLDIVNLITETGYDAALTTITGANPPSQDRYQLRRIGAWQRDLPSFALGLSYHRLVAT